MIRNFKVLGLALVAVFAINAVSASAASAAEFHSAVANPFIGGTNTNNHVFKVTGGEVTCTGATFSGQGSGSTQSEVTLSATYSGCTAFGEPAEVKMNGCTYGFKASGPVAISCPSGASIEVNNAACNLKVGSQEHGNVTYSNASGMINASAEVKELTFTKNGGSLCVFISGKGTYKGNATISAYKNEAHTEEVESFYE